VVILDPEIKRKIRIAAEAEERDNYERRFPHEWLDALAPLGTDWHKDFLDIAPCLIAVFRLDYGIVPDREGNLQKIKHYYVQESVGIACGFLIAALHWMGLATLTHTPSPMGFLSQVLKRPATRNRTFSFPSDFPRTTLRSPPSPRNLSAGPPFFWNDTTHAALLSPTTPLTPLPLSKTMRRATRHL